MAGEKGEKKGKAKKVGDRSKYTRYSAGHIREKHKIKRVLKSSGRAAAIEYATKAGLLTYLKTRHPEKKV